MIKTLKVNTLLFSASALMLITAHAHADNHEKAVDLPPVTQDEQAKLPEKTTHPIVRLTPDKSELIRLEKDAASIIVGNPAHINVIADSAKTLVIVPRLPGATHFTVLGKQGQVIMQRHVIVASPKEDYVRIKRTCSGDDDECAKTSVFYCPDMCHEISVEGQTTEATASNEGSGATGNSSNAPPSPGGNNAPDEGPDQ